MIARKWGVRILCFTLWFSAALSLHAQDFRVTKFQENMLDLTAARAAIKDNNGDLCALIKFSVRDEKFVFEPNLGVVKTEKKVGETWLYVPAKTKRITIRHPQLGMLRDYTIPVEIEQKVVYEAEIEILNKDYLNSLLEARTDTVRIVQVRDSVVYKETERPFHVLAGAGFNVTSIMGPSAFIGFKVKQHSLEVGTVIGLGKVQDVSIYQVSNSAFWGTYDFKPLRIFARYGYDISASRFVITPQVGVALTSMNGAEMRRSASGVNIFGKSYVGSATAGCRFGYRLSKALCLHVAAEYDAAVKKSNGYSVLQNFNSKIKSWGSGFNLNAGMVFYL